MIQKLVNTQQTVHLYEVLEEIHVNSTSHYSYILTDYVPKINTIIEVKYKVNGSYINNHNQRIFSIHNASWNSSETIDVNYAAQGLVCKFNEYPYNNGSWHDALATRDTTMSHVVKMTMTQLYYDNVIVATSNNTFRQGTNSIIISSAGDIAYNDQGYCDLYYFKIYEDNVLIHDYVPAKRLSDSQIGFYDKVLNTFISATGTWEYTNKSVPEYIDEQQSNATYVNDIMFNGNHINRIYLNGEVYWGNDYIPAPTPPPIPTVGNTISGTASVTSTTLYGAIKLNGTYYDIDVDANGDWTVQLSSPVNSLEQFVQNNNLRTIDLRDVEYDTYCDMSNMMISSSSSVITDIWFDFRTAPNTNFMAQGAQFANVDKISIHGFGTLQWSGVVNQTNSWTSDPTAQNCFSMRELCWHKIDHIFDIRGIDTMHADDSGYYVDNYAALNFNGGNGYWYKFLNNEVGFAQTLDTLIIGNLKIVFGSSPYNTCSMMSTLRTIYVTTTDPSFLGASSFDYIARFTNLQNIYVPVGSLNDYINDSAWAPYISIMSEQDAPDPMTI